MTGPHIFKMLDLSTAHLPEDLRDALDERYGVVAYEYEYGWLLWVPERIDEQINNDIDGELPEPVVAIWRYAAKHDCQYVLLDREADEVGDLPSYA